MQNQRLPALSCNPQRTLSTIQFFITLSGFIAAAYGGNELAGPAADYFRKYSFTAKYADALGIGAVVAMTTYLSLVIGELVPKTIAASFARIRLVIIFYTQEPKPASIFHLMTAITGNR